MKDQIFDRNTMILNRRLKNGRLDTGCHKTDPVRVNRRRKAEYINEMKKIKKECGDWFDDIGRTG